MRRTLVALLACLAFPAGAAAAPVVVLGHDGRASVRDDPFVTGPAVTPAPAGSAATAGRLRHGSRTPTHRPVKKPPPVTVASTLARLERSGAITAAQEAGAVAAYNHALSVERRLHGARAAELAAVTGTLHQIAASGALTASRLPALLAILGANVQWWASSAPLPTPYQRVEFAGSQLVWEYYPGEGIQLQVLGSFGKADGLYTAGPAEYPAMEQLLAQLIPLAAQRGGGVAWEYYFPFDGGAPPWTSAMSQATGLQALADAYRATGDSSYLGVGAQALPIFTQPPPAGVAVREPAGTRFLQYTFAPSTDIINAFLQTLIGLHAFAQASGNAEAGQLFAAGNAEAEQEVPRFDTGAWSLYQPGVEDDLSYHELVTGFLQQLCTLTGEAVYCTTAQHFTAYLTTPPVLTQLTAHAVAQRPTALRFRLSKVAHVGVVVATGGRTVFSTSAQFPYGADTVTVPALRRPGAYSVTLAATDLAGNFARTVGALAVAPAPRPARKPPGAARTGARRA